MAGREWLDEEEESQVEASDRLLALLEAGRKQGSRGAQAAGDEGGVDEDARAEGDWRPAIPAGGGSVEVNYASCPNLAVVLANSDPDSLVVAPDGAQNCPEMGEEVEGDVPEAVRECPKNCCGTPTKKVAAGERGSLGVEVRGSTIRQRGRGSSWP